MIIIYAHCRLFCHDAHRTACDPLYFDSPEIPWHVHQTLEAFKGHEVWFYSSNPSTPLHDVQAVRKKIVPDSSFDFGIYKRAFEDLYFEGRSDNVVIMNDGCFLIPENLHRLYSTWLNYDFLGITYNSTNPIPHLQTYFILFTKRMIDDERFRDYWLHYIQFGWDKWATIENGEIRMTATMASWGYNFGYFCRFSEHRMQWANPACLRAKTPILKLKQNEGIYMRYRDQYERILTV